MVRFFNPIIVGVTFIQMSVVNNDILSSSNKDELLYYAFTNTQIINLVNLKTSLHSEFTVDLYIVDNGRISEILVDSVRDEDIFRKIQVIRHTPFSSFSKKYVHLPKYLRQTITFLFTILNYLRYNIAYSVNSKSRFYQKILLSGFWMDGAYFVKLASQMNKSISVSLIEEGTSNYTLSLDKLCSTSINPHTISKYLWFIFTHGRMVEDLQFFEKSVESSYLYVPEHYQSAKTVPIYKLPRISPVYDNKLLKILYTSISQETVTQYSRYQFYYLLQNQSKFSNQYRCFRIYLHEIMASTESLILKKHPEHDVNGYDYVNLESKYPHLVIDEENYLLEALYASIILDEKVLITRDSSSVLYPKYMFGKEPTVIFTYRLYENYYYQNTEMLDALSRNLQSIYSDKSKIFVPKTVDELKEILCCIHNQKITS